jgi:alpha-D-xyloside xylohydrolase
LLFARSASAGSQKFPVHWGGDSKGNFDSMAETLRGGLSLGLSGFAYWSHDIGGFENTSPASVYKRWCAFGLLSSHSRLHGSQSYRVPWAYDEEAVAVLQRFSKLKCRLMPYLWQVAEEAHCTGVPMLRAMMLEFPEDTAADTLDRQYMLGDKLLVAPVLREDCQADYYLPEGHWTHLLSGERKTGGHWFHESYDYMSLPLFVRENTILALGSEDCRPDYDYLKDLVLYLPYFTEGGSARTAVLSLDRKETLVVTAQKAAGLLSLTFQNLTQDCVLDLADHAYQLQQGSARVDGNRWKVSAGTTELVFKEK